MPQHSAAPLERQQAAQQHEDNEQQVQQHQAIGAQAIQHVDLAAVVAHDRYSP